MKIEKILLIALFIFYYGVGNNHAIEAIRPIHMINDVTHHYSFFYAWSNKANFGGQYGYVNADLKQKMTQNQSTISTLNLENYNLFNLYLDINRDEPYLPQDANHLKHYVAKDGGGLFIVLANNSEKKELNANKLMSGFGVRLSNTPMVKPLQSVTNPITQDTQLTNIGTGRTLIFDKPEKWTILCKDANGNPVMAVTKEGNGHIAACSFTPFIQKQVKGKEMPNNYRFPNYDYTQKLFLHLASGKTVKEDVTIPKKIIGDQTIELETIEIICSAYSKRFAQNVVRDYNKVYEHMLVYMGVPLAVANNEQKLKIHLLPCLGSGWSLGNNIAIGMYAPTFIGILGHELTHSWVLPHPEPLSNEGIAIWVGNNTCIALGEKDKGEGQINHRINGALKDPLFHEWDPVTIKGEMEQAKYSKTLKHGKYMYVCQTFEKKYGTDIIAKYFQLKRSVVPTAGYNFTCHDSAWIWSEVTGDDQFAFLNSLGIMVDKKKVNIPNS